MSSKEAKMKMRYDVESLRTEGMWTGMYVDRYDSSIFNQGNGIWIILRRRLNIHKTDKNQEPVP